MGLNLTEKPIWDLIKKLAIPSSVGFFFNTMFNVVDTFYAGTLSTVALASLSASFPVFFIILSFGTGLGAGTNSLVSNSIGEARENKAKNYSTNAISLGIFISVILSILGYFYMGDVFKILRSQGEFLEYSVNYMQIINIGTIFFVLNSILNGILGAQGDTKSFRNFLILGFFINIILDPILMFGYFGFNKMGVKGVAWATVFIQVLGFLYLLQKVKKSSLLKHLKSKDFIIDFHRWKTLLFHSIPAIFNMLSISAGVFILTYFANYYGGQDAVAAFGISMRIEQMALLPTVGLNIAVISIAGQNFGAKNYDRIDELKRKSFFSGFIIMIIGICIIYFNMENLLRIFTKDSNVIKHAKLYLTIEMFTLNAYLVLNIFSSMLQGIKKPFITIVIGLIRQIIIPFPVYILLGSQLGMGIRGVWIGVLFITWTAAIFMYFAFTIMFNKIKKDSI